MKYRKLGNTGMTVSEVSLGCEHLVGKSREQVEQVVNVALDGGINFLDVFMPQADVRDYISGAVGSRRKDVKFQGHIGSCFINDQYEVRREYDVCRRFIEDFMTRFHTDYIDVAMIHNMDNIAEWDAFVESETMKYSLEMKKTGAFKAMGISTHNPELGMKAVKSGLIDVMMFSLNPAFDLIPSEIGLMNFFGGAHVDFDKSTVNPDRAALYSECEKRGVAITVMKALGAGLMFRSDNAILGKPMNVHQCINYALTRPAVAAVMVGMQELREVQEALGYYDATEEERDCVPILKNSNGFALSGKCMYCNHCLPCPAGIDVAALNRELDMAGDGVNVPDTLKAHYFSLEKTAKDCLRCGTCMTRCPFNVDVISRMDKAEAVFGG